MPIFTFPLNETIHLTTIYEATFMHHYADDQKSLLY